MESIKGQQVYFGAAGSQDFLKQILRERSTSRILLVSGKSSFEKSGASAWLLPILSGMEVVHFCDFSENPNVVDLKKDLDSYRQSTFDLIIAVGGGSVLDMAKLLGFFCTSGLDPDSYLDQKVDAEFEKQFVVAIPTTAGTGCEATHFAVLYRDRVKYSIADQSILPDVAIINPDLSSSMSPYLTACTGMDALAQAIESHWAVGATDESKKYAEKAIRLSLCYLEKAVNAPNEESRSGMAEAAYWAGRAINISKTTLCHALSYPMTSHYNYPHGHAVSLFLPKIIEEHQRCGAVSDALLYLFPNKDLVSFIRYIIKAIGLGVRNSFNEYEIEKIVSGINLERLGNNPIQFGDSEINQIVASSLNRDG